MLQALHLEKIVRRRLSTSTRFTVFWLLSAVKIVGTSRVLIDIPSKFRYSDSHRGRKKFHVCGKFYGIRNAQKNLQTIENIRLCGPLLTAPFQSSTMADIRRIVETLWNNSHPSRTTPKGSGLVDHCEFWEIRYETPPQTKAEKNGDHWHRLRLASVKNPQSDLSTTATGFEELYTEADGERREEKTDKTTNYSTTWLENSHRSRYC